MNTEEKIASLKTLKDQLSQLDELNTSVNEQTESLKQAESALKLYQTRIKEETERMIKEQRDTLRASLENEVKVAERRLERAKKRRAKERNKQVKQRIVDSNAEYEDQIDELHDQIKALVKAENLPAYCGSRTWHRLFMPHKLSDFLILILLEVILAVGLPSIIYFMIPGHQLWYAYILLPLFILLTVYPYLHILQNTREQHKDVLYTCREKFNTIDELEKKIADTTKKISESEDDSAYTLEKQDDRLNLARDRVEQARESLSRELGEFESKTRAEIVKEFQEQSQEKENELQGVIQRLSRERSLTMEMASELHLKIVDEYEDQVGAENLTAERVKNLLKELGEA